MPFEKILIADGELIIRKSIADALRSKRHSVVTAGTVSEAEKLLQRDKIDLMFLDVKLADEGGVDLLERLSNSPDRPIVIMMSGSGTIEEAVNCTRMGAFDYLTKPFSIAQIESLVQKASVYTQVLNVNRSLSSDLSKSIHLIGNSPSMLSLKQLVHKVAPTEATVLICGENGTGKELVANDIHNLSSRADGPYIKINCAAISETLIESEFFGHEKGAYTGATDRREGRFELANGGTLLLDEISEIPPNLQAKLLRVLQEREFERVGGSKTIKVDVRILATTNRDLKKAVANGTFREDLYYRLNVFPLQVPPLKERNDDVILLAETFLSRSAKKYNLKIPGFSRHAIRTMLQYRWPGNVRELQNCIERAAILSTENTAIEWESLGLATPEMAIPPLISGFSEAVLNSSIIPHAAAPKPDSSIQFCGSRESFPSLEQLEREHIMRALELTKGNRTHAANLLKISIRTLRNKLNEYKVSEVAA